MHYEIYTRNKVLPDFGLLKNKRKDSVVYNFMKISIYKIRDVRFIYKICVSRYPFFMTMPSCLAAFIKIRSNYAMLWKTGPAIVD